MSLQKDLDLIRAEIKRVAQDDSIDDINANAILDKKAKEIGFESWSKLEPVYINTSWHRFSLKWNRRN